MGILLANPILIAAAVIPAVILFIQIYRADRLEREPKSLLLSLVLRGIIATFLAVVTEQIGTWILDSMFYETSVIYRALLYFVVVAGSEEGFKYLLLRRRTWSSPDFNCQFDAVVYAVTVSLGFALWENILYTIEYGLSTALVRAVTAVPGHACFGVFMGAFYGMAKRCSNSGYPEKSRKYRNLAFFAPALIHGCYDYFLSVGNSASVVVFIIFIIALFIVASKMVKRLSRSDSYL